eukprot:1734374-Prymnesium_polylepis.2
MQPRALSAPGAISARSRAGGAISARSPSAGGHPPTGAHHPRSRWFDSEHAIARGVRRRSPRCRSARGPSG